MVRKLANSDESDAMQEKRAIFDSELSQITRFFTNMKNTNEQLSTLELEKRELYSKIDDLE